MFLEAGRSDGELARLALGELVLAASDLRQCELEGLLPLLSRCDETSLEQQRAATLDAAAWETAHRRAIVDVLESFHQQGVSALVMKGTALAYSIYDEPWQRSRVDTDLLIPMELVDQASGILESARFRAGVSLPGRYATAELAFSRTDEFGVVHTIDLHWRLNNNWRIAGAIDFETLRASREPLEKLCAGAWRPAHWANLLIACVHRAAHLNEVAYTLSGVDKMEADLILWLYDIHLLSGKMSERDWQEICEHAEASRLCVVVGDALSKTAELFRSPIPVSVFERLNAAEQQVSLDQMARQATGEITSLWAVPGIVRKCRFLLEQLFPAASYMKERYPGERLAWAYAKRIGSGLLNRART